MTHKSYNLNYKEMQFPLFDGPKNIIYKYDESDIRNVFIERSITMIFNNSIFFRIYYHIVYNHHNSINVLINCNIDLDNYHMRINWLYIGKYLSKTKYSTLNTVSIGNAPNTSLLIFILLFIS